MPGDMLRWAAWVCSSKFPTGELEGRRRPRREWVQRALQASAIAPPPCLGDLDHGHQLADDGAWPKWLGMLCDSTWLLWLGGPGFGIVAK